MVRISKRENFISFKQSLMYFIQKSLYILLCFQGGFGYDFSSNVEKLEDALLHVAKGILAHGVTSFCPTLVTSSSDVYKKVCIRFS